LGAAFRKRIPHAASGDEALDLLGWNVSREALPVRINGAAARCERGERFLRRHLCQGGWAVATKRDSNLSALFRRLAARRGNKRATMAVSHAILVIALCFLRRKQNYVELGNYFDKKNADTLTRLLFRRLESLGHRVSWSQCPTA